MKNSITLLLLSAMLHTSAVLHAQDYQISFTASGQSTSIDSLYIENLTQGTTLKLNGDDVLHLLASTGTNTLYTNKNMIAVYPNPMAESCFVEFVNFKTELVYFEIVSGTGVIISKLNMEIQQGTHRFKISGLKAGIYTVNVRTDRWKYAIKLISFGQQSGSVTINHQITNDRFETKTILKTTDEVIPMQYNEGEIIFIKGFADNFTRILTLLPSQNQIVNLEFVPCSDVDGNNYAVVSVGSQTWMAENLKTTKYTDGTDIPLVTDGYEWGGLTTPAYSWYYNDPATYRDIYGALYNWYAVETANLCPEGWHVPDDEELESLTDFIGGHDIAGGKLKSTRTEPEAHPRWNSPNEGATNEFGFSILPGGFRNSGSGAFERLGRYCRLWSNTEYDSVFAWLRQFYYHEETAEHGWGLKVYGCNIRCIRD